MPLRELSPEIWSQIFGNLYRHPPPAYEETKWKDLHQHDLTIVSRLSSTHHEIAIPHLYTSIVVHGLVSLLRSLDDAPKSLADKVTSKRDRLAKTRHMRISPTALWDDETSFDRMRDDTRKSLEDILRVLPDFNDGQISMLQMPMLESVVISRAQEEYRERYFGWIPDECHFEIGNKRSKHSEAQIYINKFIARLDPKTICSHDNVGLYAPCDDSSTKRSRLSLIRHHLHNGFEEHVMPILPGVVNQYYIDPKLNVRPMDGGSPGCSCTVWILQDKTSNMSQQYSSLQGTGEGSDSHEGAHSPEIEMEGTKIELFGLMTSCNVAKVRRHLRQGTSEEGVRRTREVDSEKEKDHIKKALPSIRAGFEGFWKDKVDIKLWGDIPKCDACEWTIDQTDQWER